MPEENSNSQSVNFFITDISERGSSGADYRVTVSDGSFFFVSRAFLQEFELFPERQVEADLLERLISESECVKALLKANDLVCRAEQSSGGLLVKLKKKDFSDFACRFAVEKMRSMNLIDDERFSALWVSSRLRRHPEGRSKLLGGLIARGVPGPIAESVLSQLVSEDDLLKALMTVGNKLFVKYGHSEQKIQRALYRRGFSSREIHYFLANSSIESE